MTVCDLGSVSVCVADYRDIDIVLCSRTRLGLSHQWRPLLYGLQTGSRQERAMDQLVGIRQ